VKETNARASVGSALVTAADGVASEPQRVGSRRGRQPLDPSHGAGLFSVRDSPR
jgi:hypothetical protein